jgi:hypothetical protein
MDNISLLLEVSIILNVLFLVGTIVYNQKVK